MDQSKYRVHQRHCCVVHGCKYSDPECPVVNKEIIQDYTCEACDDEGFKTVEELQNSLINYKERIQKALENEIRELASLKEHCLSEATYEEWKIPIQIHKSKIVLLEGLLTKE